MYFDSEKKQNTNFDTDVLERTKESEKSAPRYNVVLLDDNDHTYDYVIEMLIKICGHSWETSYEMACEVDFRGRVTVYTGDREDAEGKRDQILSYGPDWRLDRSRSSMKAVLEQSE